MTMKSRTGLRRAFPCYLKPGPYKPALAWLAARLKKARATKSPQVIAKLAGVSSRDVHSIESGEFSVSLGSLRDVVRLGYSVSFEELLAECFDVHREYFDPKKDRPFERDYEYSLRWRTEGTREPTALLIGGDPSRFLWAVPMRKLKSQQLVTEFLELAPERKRKPAGLTFDNRHEGVEVIHVIYGRIELHISSGSEAKYDSRLRAGDSIHFHARYSHYVENLEKNSSALLLVIRLPITPIPTEESCLSKSPSLTSSF